MLKGLPCGCPFGVMGLYYCFLQFTFTLLKKGIDKKCLED
jgi:hypothetical protein